MPKFMTQLDILFDFVIAAITFSTYSRVISFRMLVNIISYGKSNQNEKFGKILTLTVHNINTICKK